MNQLEEEKKEIKNIKIAKACLTALSGAAALIPHPIMTGVAIASGLGSVLLGFSADCKEADFTPAMAR